MHLGTRATGTGALAASRTAPVWAFGALWLSLFAAGTTITDGEGGIGVPLVNVVYLVAHCMAWGFAILASRRLRGPHRRLWTMLACAIPLWIAGEATVSFHHVVLGDEPPFPGLADGFFIAFYLMLIATFVIALRPVLVIRSWKAILDASVLAATVGFVGWNAVIAPKASGPATMATFVGIAYPLLDVVMLTILVSLMVAAFRRPPRSLVLLVAAIATGAVTDCALTYVSLHTTSPELSWLKIGWEAEALLLAGAAISSLRAPARDDARRGPDLRDRGLVVVLAGVVVTLLTVAVDSLHEGFRVGSGVVAFYVLAAIALRLFLTSRERERIAHALEVSLREQEHIADTDALTDIPNRRYADRWLRDFTMRDDAEAAPAVGVLVVDLDHFKEINDVHGHAIGDDVLRQVARRLRDAARDGDIIARYGGEEFLIIAPDAGPEDLRAIAERVRAVIADRPFQIDPAHTLAVTGSVGGAALPADASTLADVLRIADRALYTAKALGRNRVQVGVHGEGDSIDAVIERGSVLNFVQNLVDRLDASYGVEDHGLQAAAWAGRVADELDLDPARRWRACAAARLHDIGKLSVPAEILTHPGALDANQWATMRRHPDDGADILALAPGLREIAEVVRQHHERHDGSGYPRGLAGAEICLEARIVAVCDAWTAMRSDRPYRAALSPAEALAELGRGAGRQFAPEVVDAFVRVTRLAAHEDAAHADAVRR